MKEIRPSTWVTLGILALLIFVPAFFIDVNSLTPPDNRGFTPDPNSPIRPVNPHANDAAPRAPERKPDTPPPANQPESNNDAVN